MLDKEHILSHVSDSDAREVLFRLLDKVEITVDQNREQVSDFLDPYHARLAEGVLMNIPGINYCFDGGYPEAERTRLAVAPDFIEQSRLDAAITCLRISGNFSFQAVSHRDYLGAILALGVKREKVGDLLVQSGGCQALMDSAVAEFVQMHLTGIHQVTVTVDVCSLDELELPQVRTKPVTATVASMRLDAVAASGFGVSRSKMNSEIKAQRVRLNWKPETSAAAEVREGDVISCRGRGRVIVKGVQGMSKKGRRHLLLERLI